MLRVLLVEDHGPTLDVLTELFMTSGCVVAPAMSAEQALDLLSDQVFDLLVSDIRLPGLSGLDLLRTVKSTHPGLPVVLITGMPSVHSAVSGLRHGAYDYLPKPFSVAEVERLLKRVRQDSLHVGAPAGLAEEFTRRQLGMEGLFRVGTLAIQDLGPERFVDTILDYVVQGLRSRAAVMCLRDPDGVLRLVASRGPRPVVAHLQSLIETAVEELARADGAETRTLAGPEEAVAAVAAVMPGAGGAMGVLCAGRDAQDGAYLPDETQFLLAYAQTIALALQKLLLREKVDSEPLELMSVFVSALDSLESRDACLRGHSARVSLYAGEIATALGLSPAAVAVTRRAGLLHDLGKLALPDGVLLKPGPLTAEESRLARRLPVIGGRILRRLAAFEEEADAVLHHLEHYDGTGVPDGLQGEAIPRAARILTIADAFDAMTSPRPYRSALAVDAAVAELARGNGTQFDPAVVQAFAAIPRARLEEISQYFGRRGGASPEPTVAEPPSAPSQASPSESEGGTPSAPSAAAAPAAETPPGPGAAGPAAPEPVGAGEPGAPFLVVARGHQDLLEELKSLLGETGRVRVIEDRRADPTLLPREGREGRTHVDWEIDVAEGEGPTPQDPAPAP